MKLLKKPKIFFNPIAGSSILSITWYSGPLGDAVESNNEIGIGYFGHNGDLLSVQFDDVDAEQDQQLPKFDREKKKNARCADGKHRDFKGTRSFNPTFFQFYLY